VGQYRNLKTACPFCKQQVGNSGYKNHVTACEKKHKAIDTEFKEIQNREEKNEKTTQTQPQPNEQEETEMPEIQTETEPQTGEVILIHDTLPNSVKGNTAGQETSMDRFFEAAGRFLDKNGEIVAAVLAPIAVAFSEKAQQQQAQQQPQTQEITGEEW